MKRDLPDPPPHALKPWEVVDPHAGSGLDGWHRLMGRGRHGGMASAADLAPPAQRIGGEDFLACPSRVGNTLRYRDGRVTRLDGTPV